MRKDDNGQPWVENIDYKDKCSCDDQQPRQVNYEMMWHEADIICANCGKFIRFWDAG
jgi:hypothetical protein